MSVEAYHALGNCGLVPRRTELLYGQVFFKKPKPPLHSYLAQLLFEKLRAAAPRDCFASVGQPVTCPDSEPEPDLAVIRGSFEDYGTEHPTTAELVIEICVTSHEYDRSKLRAYATAGVKEVWLVLAPEKQIEIHLQPKDGHYIEATIHGPGETVTCVAVPGFTVEVDRLFDT